MSRGTQDTASSLVCFPLRDSHTLWSRFPSGSRSIQIGNSTHAVLQPPDASTWVWAIPISLAATFGISVIYFPAGTEMVHFPGLAHTRLCIQRAVTRVHLAGFPHSDIPGSKPACGSPRLIAACHVLHRLLAPRHPPYALSSLIIKLTQLVDPLLESTHQTSQLHTSRIPGWVNRNLGFRFCAVWTTRLRASFGLRRQSVLASLLAEFALFYPQYCSTRAELVIIHTMAPLPTVIRIGVIGVDLPAFQLSKNVFFRFHRNAPGSLGLVWRDLRIAVEPSDLAC